MNRHDADSSIDHHTAATTAFVPPEGCGCPSPSYDCPSEPCCAASSCCCHLALNDPERPAAYAPEGYSACPFCGEEVDDRRSEIMAEAHLAVEKLISVEPGSDEFWQLRREVAAFVGGEVDA